MSATDRDGADTATDRLAEMVRGERGGHGDATAISILQEIRGALDESKTADSRADMVYAIGVCQRALDYVALDVLI